MEGISAAILMFLLLGLNGVIACSKPLNEPYLIQAGLDGDIVLVLPANVQKTYDRWEIKSAQTHGKDLRSRFDLRKEGHFLYLFVTEGIRLIQPESNMNIAIQLQCEANNIKKVYTVNAQVISDKLLSKCQVFVPENSPVGTVVFERNKDADDRPKSFRTIQTKDESIDARRFFSVKPATGAVFLDSHLDYESNFKLMKLNTVELVSSSVSKIRILWIEVTNVNDNQPQIYLRDCWIEQICTSKSYVMEAVQNGPLYIYNSSSLGATDIDGDKVTFSIIKVKPEAYSSVCSINNETGIISMDRIEDFSTETRFYIVVQVTDGKYFDTTSITIKVKRLQKTELFGVPLKKYANHKVSKSGEIAEYDGLFDRSHNNIISEKTWLDLPIWFLDKNKIAVENVTEQAKRKGFNENNILKVQYLTKIKEHCVDSKLIMGLSVSELTSILKEVNKTKVEEFCDIIQSNNTNSTMALEDEGIMNEILIFCLTMPGEVLTLIDVTEELGNGSSLVHFCRNVTAIRWRNGSLQGDRVIGKRGDNPEVVSLGHKETYSPGILLAILFHTLWTLPNFFTEYKY